MADLPDPPPVCCPLNDRPCRGIGCAWWGPVLPFVNPAVPDMEVRPGPDGWVAVDRPVAPRLFALGCRRIGGEIL
jgi:hypothetical protein